MADPGLFSWVSGKLSSARQNNEAAPPDIVRCSVLDVISTVSAMISHPAYVPASLVSVGKKQTQKQTLSVTKYTLVCIKPCNHHVTTHLRYAFSGYSGVYVSINSSSGEEAVKYCIERLIRATSKQSGEIPSNDSFFVFFSSA